MWTIDSTRIFTQELSDDLGQIIPRLQPLAGDTILQIFGNETSIYKLKGYVVGYDDVDTIKTFAHDGIVHTILESPSGIPVSGMFNKNLYIKKVTAVREKTSMQTIRPDLDCYSPVFSIDLELYTD